MLAFTHTAILLCDWQTNVADDVELGPFDCDDGDVRLVNGNNSLEGRLEVCFNRVWGTVCDERFDSDDARVICNQLDVPFKGGY